MMPIPYGSFSLQLLALAAGVALFIWSLNSGDRGAVLGRFFGFIIMLLAFLSVLCTVYASVKFWTQPASVYEVVQMQEQSKDTTASKPVAHKEKASDKKK